MQLTYNYPTPGLISQYWLYSFEVAQKELLVHWLTVASYYLFIYLFLLLCLYTYSLMPSVVHYTLTLSPALQLPNNFLYQCRLLVAGFTASVYYNFLFLFFFHPTKYISFQPYIFIYITSSLLALSSIYHKNVSISLHITCILWFAYDYQIMSCQSKILSLFLFHDPLHINLCLTPNTIFLINLCDSGV